MTALQSRILFQTLDLEKFRHATSTVADCNTQPLLTVDVAKCCQQSTDDRHQLIALSVQLCVQHDDVAGVGLRYS